MNLFVEISFINIAILLIILTPSIMVFLNGLIAGTPPDWMKIFFYVWYLIMASVLLFLVILPKATALAELDQSGLANCIMLFSVGMLSLSLCVDVVNVLLIIPLPRRDQAFAERIEKVKLHLKLLNSKYEDENINSWYTAALIGIVLCIFGLNIYYLHLSDFLVATVVFLVGRYVLSGYHIKVVLN